MLNDNCKPLLNSRVLINMTDWKITTTIRLALLLCAGNTMAFDAVEVGAATGTPIYTKLSGIEFSLSVKTASTYRGTVEVALVNPAAASGNCTDTNAGLSNATVSKYVYTTPAYRHPVVQAMRLLFAPPI